MDLKEQFVDMDIVDNVASEFALQELIKIAEVVGISPISTWGSRKLIDVINAKLILGIPNIDKVKDDIRPLFLDFLYVANYIDDDKKVIESIKEDSNEVKDIRVVLEELGITDVPDCFSYADDMDPACKRCPIFKQCAEYRISNLPPCYGHLFDEANPRCNKCMESPLCKLSRESSKDRQNKIIIDFS